VVSPEALSFSIDNGPALPPSFPDGYLFEDLAVGTYTITAINDIGCVASEEVQIGEFPQINLFPSFDETQACYQEEITFGVFANGGGGGFTYFWLDENDILLGNGTTLDLIVEEPIVVTVYAEDQNGCLSDEAEMEVFFGPPITADISPDPDVITYICEGDQITISADLGGGLGFVAPEWVSLSTGQTISNQASFTIVPDDDDFYVLTAVDGCSQPLIDTVHVVVMETPVVELAASPFQKKFGQDKQDTLPRYCRECEVKFACQGECPKHRFIRTPDGEPGLNYLCPSFQRFFGHTTGAFARMADLLRAGRHADEIMAEVVPQPYPARSTVGITSLPKGAQFEVEAILVIRG
jgi:radical SAM protein with 4Fe4S-binding SPASM domain